MRAVVAIFAVAAFAAAAVVGGARPAIAEETLLMLERPGCVWCARWREDVGDVYDRTAEGRRAPLRRVDVSRGWPSDLSGVAPDVVTPTFILLRDGAEVARIRGYPGEAFFWGLLGQALDATTAP